MKNFGTRDEYRKITQKWILGQENCPFCGPHLDVEQIIWEGKFWRIMYNKYPYIEWWKHIMALPKEHKKFSTDFSSDEWQEMKDVHEFMKNFFQDSLYFSFTRENFFWETGDWRSVEHWHMHFVPGSLKWKYIREMLENQWFIIPK